MGTQIDLGKVVGEDGKSPYQVAVEEGYTGTEADFNAALVSLQNAPFMPETPKNIALDDSQGQIPYIKFGNGQALRYDSASGTLTCVPANQAETASPDYAPFGCDTPTHDFHAANKKYVDDLVGDIGDFLDEINGEVV